MRLALIALITITLLVTSVYALKLNDKTSFNGEVYYSRLLYRYKTGSFEVEGLELSFKGDYLHAQNLNYLSRAKVEELSVKAESSFKGLSSYALDRLKHLRLNVEAEAIIKASYVEGFKQVELKVDGGSLKAENHLSFNLKGTLEHVLTQRDDDFNVKLKSINKVEGDNVNLSLKALVERWIKP